MVNRVRVRTRLWHTSMTTQLTSTYMSAGYGNSMMTAGCVYLITFGALLSTVSMIHGYEVFTAHSLILPHFRVGSGARLRATHTFDVQQVLSSSTLSAYHALSVENVTINGHDSSSSVYPTSAPIVSSSAALNVPSKMQSWDALHIEAASTSGFMSKQAMADGPYHYNSFMQDRRLHQVKTSEDIPSSSDTCCAHLHSTGKVDMDRSYSTHQMDPSSLNKRDTPSLNRRGGFLATRADGTAANAHSYYIPTFIGLATELCRRPLMQFAMVAIGALAWVAFMMPQGGGSGGSRRPPPRWDPQNERSYSFRDWSQDVLRWCMGSELQPHQQCLEIINALDGPARRLGRLMSPQQIMNGGTLNGAQVDPVTLLVTTLQQKFAPLSEESRLSAMTDFITFRREPNERINELLTRYDVARERAAHEANYVMTWEGYTITLLRVVGINDSQLIQLLAPLNGQIPTDEQQYVDLMLRLRRMGHIIEHQPGNIASALRPGSTQAFFAGDGTGEEHASSPWDDAGWADSAGVRTNDGYANAQSSTVQDAYHTDAVEQPDIEDTDSDTASDHHSEPDEDLWWPDVAELPEEQYGEALFWAYERAKQKWRRFANKPTRRVRRFVKRKGKGKGRKGNGKGKGKSSVFLAEAYFRHKGKGSSGKGFGRKKNPIGKDGRVMTCSECGSEEHFRARCPKGKGKGKSKSSASSSSGPGINLYVS